MIHYSVSIEQHIARCEATAKSLPAGPVALLWALWGQVRSPFSEQPHVFASYDHLARRTGLARSTVEKHSGALQRAGCLRKLGSVTGRGTEYVLIRPDHTAEDARRNPFDPSEVEYAAEAALLILRNDGLVTKPRVKSARKKAPPIKPSAIGLALEDMAGVVPCYKTDAAGKRIRKGVLPYSVKCGDWSAVKAAQAFIKARDWDTFVAVCKAAQGLGAFKPEALDRARLFEDEALVEQLLKCLVPKPVGYYSLLGIATKLAPVDSPEHAAALAVLDEHWQRIGPYPYPDFKAYVQPWLDAPPSERLPVARLIEGFMS